MTSQKVIALGIAFYDIQREQYGATDRDARHETVSYMRRKDADTGDAMPYYEALANALSVRATSKLSAAQAAIIQE